MAVPALDATAPRVVGRYMLYGEIASGGMATVHFGRLIGAAGFARPVAIKRLHAQFARDPEFVKMFLDEARLAARIAHPNVVPTLDVVDADNEVFLVMEYVRGASLAQLVRTVRRKGERIQPLIGVGIVSGMLQGLHAAHEARNDRGERLDLVHRDVSPQNVIVGTDGIARLLDFGVAKAAGRLQTTRDGQLKGKLAYMAPEQVKGDPLTRRTDVYAASVVLWEVLTGQRLFFADNEANVLARVLNAEVPLPSSVVPGLPRSLDRVALRGLERDPSKRYATAREMAAELDACIGVASPTEIGDWVERVAADELRARASHIADVERVAAESADKLPNLSTAPGLGGPGAPLSKRSRDVPSNIWAQTTRNERVLHDGSQVSSLSLARATDPPGRPSRRLVSAIAVSAVAAVVIVLLLVVFQTHTHAASLSQTSPASASSSTASGLVVAPPTAPISTVRVEDLPPVPDPTPIPTEAAPPRAAPPVSTLSQHTKATSSDCNPPYTVDAKGHIHFKPNCL